jgi:hypothetical protein
VSDDKPGHIITIPDSLGRDVDKFREGKLKEAPPIEAFMSTESLEQVEKQTQAAAAPLQAADLVPITKEEGARRTRFNGESLPSAPATRRVIPPPFQRPAINLVSAGHGREWTMCPAEDVKEGDMVVDVGRIARDAETVIRYETIAGIPDVAVSMKVILTGVTGNQLAYQPGQRVRAFRLAELCRVAGAARRSWTLAAARASPQTDTPPTSTSSASTTAPGR